MLELPESGTKWPPLIGRLPRRLGRRKAWYLESEGCAPRHRVKTSLSPHTPSRNSAEAFLDDLELSGESDRPHPAAQITYIASGLHW